MTASDRLEEFGLSPLPHTGLFGVFLGVHAVEGLLNVLHTGVGCKGKTQRQIVHHDLGQDAHTKIGWTELDEIGLIRDPGETFFRSLGDLAARRKPSAILVTASAAVEFAGLDLAELAAKARSLVDCPLEVVPGSAFLPDLYAGYAAVIQALLRMVPWDRPVSEEPSAGVAGYFFHRHEMDQAANLAELRRLLSGVGIRPGPVFLSGEALPFLEKAHRSGAMIWLPHAGPAAGEFESFSGRKAIETGLPLGIRATGAWLREVAGSHPASLPSPEPFIQNEAGRAEARLRIAKKKLTGRRIAIVADTPTAAGWTLLAQELGLEPVLTVLIDQSLGEAEAYHRWMDWAGGEAPSGMKLFENPGIRELGSLCQRGEPKPFDLAVRPDLGLSGTGWEDVPTLETGFPANHQHFVFPLPELGYAGAVALAQRLMDVLSTTSQVVPNSSSPKRSM